MYERVIKALNAFQIQYAVCGQELFRDWVVKKSGVNLPPQKFRFERDYYDSADKSIKFYIDEIKIDELKKFLKLFNIHLKDHKISQYITLNEKQVFERLLPKFMSEIDSIAKESPNKLRHYQLTSRSKLESNAIADIKTCADWLLDQINKNIPDIGMDEAAKKSLKDLLLCVKGILSIDYDHYLADLMDAQAKFHQIFDGKSAISNQDFSSHISELKNAFAAYAKFNRVEITNEVKKFHQEIEQFANTFRVSPKKCDIFEETLYSMAAITTFPKASQYQIDNVDASRFYFKITEMSDEDLKKFIELFKSFGDDSAKKINEGYYYDDGIFEGDAMHCSFEEKCAGEPEIKLKIDRIVADGEILAKKIFPEFKKHIQLLADTQSSILKGYQDKSKEYIDEQFGKEITNSSSSSSSSTAATLEDNPLKTGKEEGVEPIVEASQTATPPVANENVSANKAEEPAKQKAKDKSSHIIKLHLPSFFRKHPSSTGAGEDPISPKNQTNQTTQTNQPEAALTSPR